MDEWGVLQVIVYIVSFLAVIVPMAIKLANVIQKNTDAITRLTDELNALTIDNEKDHSHFHKSINALNQDMALVKEKHNHDIELLKQQFRKD